jgi:hypothetical protein
VGRRLAWICLAGGLAAIAGPSPARAWGTREHQEIGSLSYREACDAIERILGPLERVDPPVRARFEIACVPRAALARRYGDATAIAGDYVGHPSELFSPTGAWRFSSRRHYYWLALENSEHFNPFSTEAWRQYHQAALDEALRGANAEGLARIDAWDQALRENAYGDHLLQDSFAAGHMGFNRRASSAAAARQFHNYWNAHGRAVNDWQGQSWVTYGDGKLDDPAGAAARRHVLDAATGSVHDLLATFVFGRRSPEESLAVWRSLPFTMEAPELLVDSEGLLERRATGDESGQIPLVTAVLPARKDTVAHAKLWTAAPFSHGWTAALTANLELAVPVLPAQASFGAGGTVRQPNGRHSAVGEFGLLVPLGLSIDGLISHELEAAASLLFGNPFSALVHLEYQGNLELGTALAFIHLGLAEFLPERRTGWYTAVGFGWALSAAGGGAFSR